MRERVGWYFEPSQPQRITAGTKEASTCLLVIQRERERERERAFVSTSTSPLSEALCMKAIRASNRIKPVPADTLSTTQCPLNEARVCKKRKK